MKLLVTVSLTVLCIVTRIAAAGAQVTSFIAQTIVIDGRNYVAGRGLNETERRIAEAAAKAPEGWDAAAQTVFRNMIFMTASQVATLRAVDDAGQIKLPIEIRPADLNAAVLTWDTSIDNDCISPTRIARGNVRWSDVLLFSGDYEKLVKITLEESAVVRAFQSPTAFSSLMDRSRGSADKSGRRSLVQAAIDGNYLRLQQFLLSVKADLATQKDTAMVTNNAQALAKRLGLR